MLRLNSHFLGFYHCRPLVAPPPIRAASASRPIMGEDKAAITRGWVLTMLGGLHYGYHVGVVAAAASGVAEHLGEDLQAIEVASAAALAGAIVGSPLSGVICERFGRRAGTVVGETIGLLGALCCAAASGYHWIWVGRLLVGLGIGFCTLAKPLYIQETVGPAGRPILAGFAPAVAAGVLLSKASGELHWRVAFALGALPAVSLLSVAAFWMPESPAWLRARANSKTASGARKPVSGGRACDARGLVLAMTLGLANQATGSYAYTVYSDLLFHSAQAELFTMIVAALSVLGALLVVPLMSCCRSRMLMVGGLLLMAALSIASSGDPNPNPNP